MMGEGKVGKRVREERFKGRGRESKQPICMQLDSKGWEEVGSAHVCNGVPFAHVAVGPVA